MPNPKGKMSFIAAAYEILKSANESLTPKRITELALSRGLIKTGSKRPSATMGARLLTDKRFVSAGSGTWKLKD